jgi:hypothetical protein
MNSVFAASVAEAIGLGIDVFLDGAVGSLGLALGHAQCIGVLVLACAGGTGNTNCDCADDGGIDVKSPHGLPPFQW